MLLSLVFPFLVLGTGFVVASAEGELAGTWAPAQGAPQSARALVAQLGRFGRFHAGAQRAVTPSLPAALASHVQAARAAVDHLRRLHTVEMDDHDQTGARLSVASLPAEILGSVLWPAAWTLSAAWTALHTPGTWGRGRRRSEPQPTAMALPEMLAKVVVVRASPDRRILARLRLGRPPGPGWRTVTPPPTPAPLS